MSFSLGGGRNKQSQTQSQQFNQTSTFALSPRAADMLGGQIGLLRGMGYQGFDPASMAQFQSPYQQQVIDATMARLGYEADVARSGLKSDMAKAGAFGNNRRAILEAELEGQIDRNRTEALAGLNQQGFDRALAAAMAENQNRNAYGLDLQSLISQLIAGGFGREGTEVSSGTSSGQSSGRSSGFNFGFSWAPRFGSGG